MTVVIEEVIQKMELIKKPDLDILGEMDRRARIEAKEIVKKIVRK
jgi:hypothetical protein